MIPAEPFVLPVAAREAEIGRLHLGRNAVESLRAQGVTTIGDLIEGQYLSREGWDALGREGGKAIWAVVQELRSFCVDDSVDWLGFWASRGIAIVPQTAPDDPDVAALAKVAPALLKAALHDSARGLGDPGRAWVIIDGRNGLVSQPKTLEELGAGVLGLTRERIRQIEIEAMRHLRRAWGLRFRGTTYRVNEALDPVLARFADTCAAVDGPVTEADLLAMLGLPATLPARDLRLVEFLLELGGLQRFGADGARRRAMWAPQSHASAGPRIVLADRIGRLLAEGLTGAVSSTDITAALNRGAKGNRVTLRDVEGALPLSPLVEQLEDGRWQGRFEFLIRRADQAFRILDAAGGPLDLREVVREINARSRAKSVTVRNLSNQLVEDDRFVSIGKSGSWGIAARDAAAAVTIVDLMQEVLRRAGKPMSAEDIEAAVRARRPVGENSVSMYLTMRSEFVRLPDRTWALATWPEAVALKAQPRVPRPGERIAAAAITYLKAAPGQEARLRDLVGIVARKLGLSADRIYPTLGRHPAFERFERDGDPFVRLTSDDPIVRVPVRRKSYLVERMAAIVIPYLASAPGQQRELVEVVRFVAREMNTIPNTVYAYLKRIPEIERIDEGDRKLVRLVVPAVPVAPATPVAAVLGPSPLEVRVRELIAVGETPAVEFKSTLMWSTKGNVKDAKLQKMVTKTIAAFANTRGGTLLIGVEPDGGVCGIELDCAILRGRDDTCVDAFSRSLAAIIDAHLGTAMAAHVATHYAGVDGKTVCVVDVDPSLEAVYLKADVPAEVYVRSGTTSVALPVPEIAGYIRSHWREAVKQRESSRSKLGSIASPGDIVGLIATPQPVATRAEVDEPAVSGQAAGPGLVGIALAQKALDVFQPRAGAYSGGIRIDDLVRELRLAEVVIGGRDPRRTLRDALNSSQVRGVWQRQDGATWVPGTGVSKMSAGLAGRALAKALHEFVRVKYPAGEFQYEVAREELEATGVQVRGTGETTRTALESATDLFERVPDRRAYWRWK